MTGRLSMALRISITRLACGVVMVAAAGCTHAESTAPTEAPAASAPFYGFLAVHSFPHDPDAFTQGLIYRDGFLYESTGLNGKSSVRKVVLDTGKVLQRREVDQQYFAEGLTDWDNRLMQLTWQTHVGFVYDIAKFESRQTFQYTGEGWGLTHDGTRLIMSDGTSRLRFLDPASFKELGSVNVTDGGRPVDKLNELEMVDGEIYANVWMTERIAIIAPATGQVTAWLDLTGLRQPGNQGEDVLNGIAYDAAAKRLFVTGKLWHTLYEIRVRR